MRRWEWLRKLTLAEAVNYFERELSDGVPIDFAEWLSELIDEE